MFEIEDVIDYPRLIVEHKNHTEIIRIIWTSIIMSAKNSSLRKEETAIEYCKKELGKENKDLELEITQILTEIINTINTDTDIMLATLGRAMHNITYIRGSLNIKSENNTVINTYSKLGINRVFVRKMQIV